MRDEVVQWLAPRAGGVYCDATAGFGGHARAILQATAPTGRLIGIDRDGEALAVAREELREFGDRVLLVHSPFSRVRGVLEQAKALPLDGCLADLGVSSPQLDEAGRGFSFMRAGPLDMRMDRSQGETAADYLKRVSEADLEAVLRQFGEERYARHIAREIVRARQSQSENLASTTSLAALIARAVPRRERNKNPATRSFQALRIAVNEELVEVDRFLADAPGCLAAGGRLVVIAFHSLEDRLVKYKFRAMAKGAGFRVLTKHVVVASGAETAGNPRARSAHLRVLERTAA